VIEEMKVKFDDEEHDQSEDKDESTKARLDNLENEDGLEEVVAKERVKASLRECPLLK
jgi:hypothetical protein